MEQKCYIPLSVNVGFIGAGNMAKAIGEGMINSGSEAASWWIKKWNWKYDRCSPKHRGQLVLATLIYKKYRYSVIFIEMTCPNFGYILLLITSNIIIRLFAYIVISKAVSCIKNYNVGINKSPTLSGPNIFNPFCYGRRTIIVSQLYGSWYCLFWSTACPVRDSSHNYWYGSIKFFSKLPFSLWHIVFIGILCLP